MRYCRSALSCLLLLILAHPLVAQPLNLTARRIQGFAAPPATCNFNSFVVDFGFDTVAGKLYICSALNTWTLVGPGGVPGYPLLAPNGTAAVPSFSFTNAAGAGMFLSSAAGGGALGFATNSVERWTMSASGGWNCTVDGGCDVGNGSADPRDLNLKRQIVIRGLTSGSLTILPAAIAGAGSVITLPGGTTDFSATGGTSQVVRQSSVGAPLTVGTLASTNLSDTASVARSSNNLSFFSATTSLQLATLLTDESGTGSFMLNTSPIMALSTTIFSDSSLMLQDKTNNTRTVFRVAPHGTVVNTPAAFEFYGTDFAADAVNYERITLNAKGSGDSAYILSTSAGGTGTVRDLQMTTGSNSGLTINGSTGAGSYGGALTQTSTSASAFVSGANGATNPALKIDNSTASAATGISITAKAAAGGVTVAAISSGSNETLTLSGKGTGGAAIIGTSTNDNGCAGCVGELITGTVSANTTTLSTGTTANVGTNTNISLTAGDWDCSGVVNFTYGAATSITNLAGGVSTTSATLPAQDSYFDYETAANIPTAAAVAAWVAPTVRVSVAPAPASPNVWLVTQVTFTSTAPKAGGTIRCRRIR